MWRKVLKLGLMALVLLSGSGCQFIVEALGYTVVDEELQQVCMVRDTATQKYVDWTLPLLEKGLDGERLLEVRDLGETLKRVSALERQLICRE